MLSCIGDNVDAGGKGCAAPLRYHAIVSSPEEAESTSRSPSPSMSAAKTLAAPSAPVVISVSLHALPSPPPEVASPLR